MPPPTFIELAEACRAFMRVNLGHEELPGNLAAWLKAEFPGFDEVTWLALVHGPGQL